MTATDWLSAIAAAAAVVISVVALVYARSSASSARLSAEASARSAAVAERDEQRKIREAEQRSVLWRCERIGDAVVKLWNDGDSTAYDVHVDVSHELAVHGIPPVIGVTVGSGDGVRVGASVKADGELFIAWRRTPTAGKQRKMLRV